MKYTKGDIAGFHKDEKEIFAEAASADWQLQELFKKDKQLQNYFYDWMEAKTLYYEETARIYRDMYTKILKKMEERGVEREEAELEHYMRRRYARIQQQQEEEQGAAYEHDLEKLTNAQLVRLLLLCVEAIVAITRSSGEALVQYQQTRIERIAQRIIDDDGGAGKPPLRGAQHPAPPRR